MIIMLLGLGFFVCVVAAVMVLTKKDDDYVESFDRWEDNDEDQ